MEYKFARVRYHYNKLTKIREGIYPENGGNVEFDLFSFFEACYHLKDWIKNSPDYERLSDVEVFVNNSPAMRICADICNTLKHKNLRSRRSYANVGEFYLESTATIGPETSRARINLGRAAIKTERGEECCYALAGECIEEWERYFYANSIQSL